MHGPIYSQLAPVRRRQQEQFLLQAATYGLLVGALAGLVLGLGRRLAGWEISFGLAVSILLAGPVMGLLLGIVCRRSWRGAAVAVDTHYRLKDRTATALAFLAKAPVTPLHELQLHDAEVHLTAVQPRQVVPIQLPRTLLYVAGLLVLALALLLWPSRSAVVEAALAGPPPSVLEEAKRIQEDLKEFEELARKENNKELENLVQELREKVEEMKQPGVDEREALAKLSEMQAAIAAHQAQYNVGLVDGQLQALGEALSAAQALDGAGRALQEAKYEKAAKELEELEEPQFDRKEAQALEEKLRQVAKGMGDVGLGQMSQAASEMAEGARGGKGKFQKASKEMAKMVSKHGRLRKINNLLEGELARLSEGKCNCQANSTAKGKMPQKSLSPTSSWGMGTSGNTQGDKTSLLSQRNLEQLTGTPGEGPSEAETTHSAEGRQQASRQYKDVYQKYRRMSEAVLDSEPIPLGHRQTIRKYFELIRPTGTEAEKKD